MLISVLRRNGYLSIFNCFSINSRPTNVYQKVALISKRCLSNRPENINGFSCCSSFRLPEENSTEAQYIEFTSKVSGTHRLKSEQINTKQTVSIQDFLKLQERMDALEKKLEKLAAQQLIQNFEMKSDHPQIPR